MKKLFYTLLALLLFSQTGFSQNVNWGPWNPVSCWKGLHFHLSKGDYNASAQKYTWYCQFKNDYNQPVSFEFSILSPEEVASYQAGTWSPSSLGRNGRMTLSAGEDQSADPKDYFGVQPGTSALFTSGTKLFVAIKNVRFGNDDQSLPYATDECGRLSGKNDSAPVNDGGDAVGSTKKDADDLKSNDAKQQVDAVAPVQIATPVVTNYTQAANSVGLNANSRQTQEYINRAQNPNIDATTKALYVSQAKINAMKPGGATAAQLQQIQQLDQQQADAAAKPVQSGTTDQGSDATQSQQIGFTIPTTQAQVNVMAGEVMAVVTASAIADIFAGNGKPKETPEEKAKAADMYAKLSSSLENQQNAAAAFESSMAGKPPTKELYYNAGLCYTRVATTAGSCIYFAPNGRPRTHTRKTIKELLEDTRDESYTKAAAFYTKALAIDPNDFELNYEMAVALLMPVSAYEDHVINDNVSFYTSKLKKAATLATPAEPYVLKAAELNPTSEKALQLLWKYYFITQDDLHKEEVNQRLKAIDSNWMN